MSLSPTVSRWDLSRTCPGRVRGRPAQYENENENDTATHAATATHAVHAGTIRSSSSGTEIP